MKRKGFTLIELLVLIAIGFFLLIFIGAIVLGVKGCNYVVDTVETTVEENAEAKAARLESDPPTYKVGDIVYHKASEKRLLISDNAVSWNEVQECWNIKVKDGGNWDKVGGQTVSEAEVKPTLKEVGR